MNKLTDSQVITAIQNVLPVDSILQKEGHEIHVFSILEDFENYKETVRQDYNESFNDFIYRVICVLFENANTIEKEMIKNGVTNHYDFMDNNDVIINAAIHLGTVSFYNSVPSSSSC
jgi:hypothetical protein